MNHSIRAETPLDIAAIHAVTKAAFLDAPHTDHNEQFITDAIRETGGLTLSLIAEQAGVVIGHVAVSAVSISDGSAAWYGLGPISVSPEHQGVGVGSSLMREALSQLQGLGANGCVLLGDPAYYARFGFKTEAQLVLPDVPPEYFQALTFGSSLPCGVVTYHPAFQSRG